jgi:hypothetical protein
MNQNVANKDKGEGKSWCWGVEELGMLFLPATPNKSIIPIKFCTTLEKGFFSIEEKYCIKKYEFVIYSTPDSQNTIVILQTAKK